MALDVAMGGSTNTVLHLLAAAREAELDFTVADIDAISRRVPCLCQGRAEHAASTTWRTCTGPAASRPSSASWTGPGCCTATCTRSTRRSLDEWLAGWDVRGSAPAPEAVELFHAAPGGVRTTEPFSTSNRWSTLDTDAADGCIRDVAHAYSADGGLAVLYGNLAPDGCVVKTAGVSAENLTFRGPAKVFESQEDAVSGILAGAVVAGDVVVIRYEGPQGRPGHAGDALPDLVPQRARASGRPAR